jgi:hypothetical protein
MPAACAVAYCGLGCGDLLMIFIRSMLNFQFFIQLQANRFSVPLVEIAASI